MDITRAKTSVIPERQRNVSCYSTRAYRIEANIWLTTDQANGSWPITIGFVWPSVLEHMSSSIVARTPVTLDFHLTLINATKVSVAELKTISISSSVAVDEKRDH